jgi:hypothetical protein
MKRILCATVLTIAALPAFAANVGVSINVGEPGFYGRIDLGDVPPPQLIYSAPVVIQPTPYGVVRQPIYLHVPPAYTHDWGRYCGRYQACGQPVYFVDDNWYNSVYVPHYRERDGWRGPVGRGRGPMVHGPVRGPDHGPDHGPGRGPDRDDHRGKGHDRDHDDHGNH